jgi:hypothetical protein
MRAVPASSRRLGPRLRQRRIHASPRSDRGLTELPVLRAEKNDAQNCCWSSSVARRCPSAKTLIGALLRKIRSMSRMPGCSPVSVRTDARVLSLRAIRARLNVGQPRQPRAQRIRTHLAGLTSAEEREDSTGKLAYTSAPAQHCNDWGAQVTAVMHGIRCMTGATQVGA